MNFDRESVYSSKSKNLFERALGFAKKYCIISQAMDVSIEMKVWILGNCVVNIEIILELAIFAYPRVDLV